MLSHHEARAFYDCFGARQDRQGFYEDPPIFDLIEHAAFGAAEAVFEFGCGTGKLAKILLDRHLPAGARYKAVDISSTMVALARKNLAPFGTRVEVIQSGGEMRIGAPPNSFDRFVSAYVLDLLTDDDIRVLLAEAYRSLTRAGLLCLVSLTHGDGFVAKFVAWLWRAVHAKRPALVGGCRPIALREYLDAPRWRIRHRRVVTAFGISSEVVVAEKLMRE